MENDIKTIRRKAFAGNLTGIMKSKNITVQRLGKDIGVGIRTIRRWLNSESVPNIGQLLSLADYFECSIESLTNYN